MKAMIMAETQTPLAAVLLIGDEILSGRTKDANLAYIAEWLAALGIRVAEARIVPDIEAEIVAAVRALSGRYDYVFTTGGIGPTHDDITADCMANAFNVPIDENAQARLALLNYYGAEEKLTPGRLRMARIPHGAQLIDNPVSGAPGFQINNVFVMAGIPNIMQAMLGGLSHRLQGGPKLLSESIKAHIGESRIAADLALVAAKNTAVNIGSYPHIHNEKPAVSLVVRGTDADAIAAALADIRAILVSYNVEVIEVKP